MAPPFLGRSLRHLRNNYGDDAAMLNNGNKVVHLASFRVLHVPRYYDGFQLVFPFIFIIFSVYAQWFATGEADGIGVADMLASTLQLNTIITAQGDYLLYNNKVTRVIYLTYAIVLAKIFATANMASIHSSELLGKYPRLVRHSYLISRTLRLAAFLASFFLLPILVVHTDNLTGQQYDYPFLYYIVGFGNLVIMLIWGVVASHKDKKAKKKVVTFREATGPSEDWSAEDVANWIDGSELLQENASLTEGELAAIASKFLEAKVKGAVFPGIAYDEDRLMKVGLTIGEAALFVHTMNSMESDASVVQRARVMPNEKECVVPVDTQASPDDDKTVHKETC